MLKTDSQSPLSYFSAYAHSCFPIIAIQVACKVADSIAKLSGSSGGLRSASGSGSVYPGEQSCLSRVCTILCVCTYFQSCQTVSAFDLAIYYNYRT
jgi:hypothetical protein